MNELTWCARCDRLLSAYSEFIEAGDRLAALVALNTYDDHRDQAHGPGEYPA